MVWLSVLGLAALSAVPVDFAPKIGLALSVPEGGGEEEFLTAIRQQIRLRLDGNVLSLKWDEFEAQSGKPLTDGLGAMRLMGQDGLLTIGTLDTLKRRLPADVAEKAWDDPILLARWVHFLSEITPKLGKQVKWVSLGNEVDGYLPSHPGEIDAYIRFLQAGRQAVRQVRPDLLVGVTVMCMESRKDDRLARRLQESMDVTIFTYYPHTGGPGAADPERVGADFDFMLSLAGSRPLLLQEIGFPASEKAGGSEAKQADFVHAVFAQLDRHGAKIPLADYFMQSDFPPSLMGVLEQYYGISDPGFLAFLGSLGLRDAKGRPRPAWNAFQEEILKRKAP